MRTDYFRIAYGVSRFELRLMQRNKTAFADPLISRESNKAQGEIDEAEGGDGEACGL
jgi:hypothetical protein